MSEKCDREGWLKRLSRFIITKLVLMNDTPHKIALGLGVGVFTGMMPAMGPVAAIALAFVFRANRAAALLGSFGTNTWISIVTFLLSIKIGSAIMGLEWHQVYGQCRSLTAHFKWGSLFKVSFLKILFPLFLGYFVVAFCLGFIVYLLTLALLKRVERLHG